MRREGREAEKRPLGVVVRTLRRKQPIIVQQNDFGEGGWTKRNVVAESTVAGCATNALIYAVMTWSGSCAVALAAGDGVKVTSLFERFL